MGALLEHDNGWSKVVRKRKSQAQGRMGKLDVATNAWKISYKDTFSFYFSEFPETHGAKEMLKAFKLYGDAMEVVIPPKRDKRGRRFGFVRFINVGDPRMFAVKLDNIIFGAKKIHVNVPKFQREKNEGHKPIQFQQQRELKQQEKFRKNHQQQRQVQMWRKKEDGDIGGRKKESHQEKPVASRIVYHRKNNISEVYYTVPEEEMQKFRKMYVATVRTPGSTYYIHEWFNMQGFFSIKVTPLGANKALLEEMEEGIIQDLLKDYYDWLHEKFEDIRGWDPDDADGERVVWVRCHGIPIHAWNEDFFASLARNFGEFLGVDESTRTKSAMDIARIRLRSRGYDVFNAVVTANINGSLFHIKMVEEWCGPLQWIDNECKKKGKCGRNYDDSDDSSDSGDSHGGGPPLFTVEEEWCNNSEEEWEDEGSQADGRETEKEEENGAAYEEVSMVQETSGIFDGKQHSMNDTNDCEGGRIEPTGSGIGNQNNLIDEDIKVGLEVCEEVVGVTHELTHISNTGGGGSQLEVNVGMMSGENNLTNGGVRNEGGCENESPAKTKKIKKKAGPGGEKKKDKRKKKKKNEAQLVKNKDAANVFHFDDTEPETSHNNSQEKNTGVVRNPINQFEPNPSASISSRVAGPDSQVSSVGDSGIMMGNNRFEKAMERLKAEKLWSLAKDKLGVSVENEDDEFYIEKIKAMEERDKVAKGSKGKPQMSK